MRSQRRLGRVKSLGRVQREEDCTEPCEFSSSASLETGLAVGRQDADFVDALAQRGDQNGLHPREDVFKLGVLDHGEALVADRHRISHRSPQEPRGRALATVWRLAASSAASDASAAVLAAQHAAISAPLMVRRSTSSRATRSTRSQDIDLVAGDDRQPGEIGLDRLVGRIDAHRQVDRALMVARPVPGSPGARIVTSLRSWAGEAHDNVHFRAQAGAVPRSGLVCLTWPLRPGAGMIVARWIWSPPGRWRRHAPLRETYRHEAGG